MPKNESLQKIAERFRKFHEEFSQFFQTKTRDGSAVAGHYLNGLVQTPKKNMERMEEKVPESNEQALQHFITNSPWDEKPLLEKVASEADKILGGKDDSCLLIDESAFPKKGKKSVGVARQYCGRLGKIENCQVAVFSALASNHKSIPIDFRLYLPQEWTDDPQRCLDAGIPASEIQLKSKAVLAIELVKSAKERKIQFNWVGADAGYGKDPGFLGDLFDLCMLFVVDVQKNQKIYASNPRVDKDAKSIDAQTCLMAEESDWKTVTLRQSGGVKVFL